MTSPSKGLAGFEDQLHEAAVLAVTHASLDWSAIVALAGDMLAAGIDNPAVVEMACLNHDARSDDCRRQFVAMLHELDLPTTPLDPRVLSHFVHNDDITSLLGLVTVDDIAAAWLRDRRETEDDPSGSGPDGWASALWYSPAWYVDSARTRATVVAMLQQAGSEDVARIGAGPLESLVTDGESTLSWAEEQARQSPRFRTALTHAWLWNQLSPEAFSRVERAAGTSLPRPAC